MEYFDEGILITASAATLEDAEYICEAELAPENRDYVNFWTKEKRAAAFADSNILQVIFKDKAGNRVGFAIVCGLENQSNCVELMRLAMTEKGHGYGQEALTLVKRLAFERLNAHRLWLDVLDHNLRAQHVYEKMSFVKEGLLRECSKYGDKYESVYIMSVLDREYFE